MAGRATNINEFFVVTLTLVVVVPAVLVPVVDYGSGKVVSVTPLLYIKL